MVANFQNQIDELMQRDSNNKVQKRKREKVCVFVRERERERNE